MFAILGGIGTFIAIALGFIGLMICVYAHIGSLPDGEESEESDNKKESQQ